MKTYTIETIHDLLKVPTERWDDCLLEISLALNLHELAFGDHALETEIGAVHWTDDDDKSISISDLNNTPVISLKVTKA